MNLDFIGSTDLRPQTHFLWSADQDACVEITDFKSHYLVRASKSYRLLKQGEEGRTHIQNITNLNDYLADTFPSFQITVNYSDSVIPEATDIQEQAEEATRQSQELLQRRQQLAEEVETLKRNVEHGFDELREPLEAQLIDTQTELDHVDAEIQTIKDHLERRKRESGEWKENGVMLSYLFTFSTDPDIIPEEELDTTVRRHLQQISTFHRRKAKQKLEQSQFKLRVEELDHPRVFNRVAYTSLLNPENLNQFIEQHSHLEDQLTQLRDETVAQYRSYALRDLEVDDATFERKRTAPAHAVKAILEELDTEQQLTTVDAPNTGPMIGTVADKRRIVGFDLFDHGPHYYIAGKTGTGKTHLKRVFIENAASQGYNVLTISPTKRDSIGLNLPNRNSDRGTGLQFDQYWFGDDRLLDKPDEITDLFTGHNAVTLYGYGERQEFINDLFTTLDATDLGGRTLFVFLDESHRFNDGDAADAIQTIAQEGRSHGIRLVLVSQNPKSFQYSYKEVRNNTSFILFNRNYEVDIQKLVSDPGELSSLDHGVCVFADFLDLPEMEVEIRDTLTRLWSGEPSDDEIEQVNHRFSPNVPEFDSSASPRRTRSSTSNQTADTSDGRSTTETSYAALSEKQEQLLTFIRQYIQENDKAPTKSRCSREGPISNYDTLTNVLDRLVEKGIINEIDVVRGGNDATAFQPR